MKNRAAELARKNIRSTTAAGPNAVGNHLTDTCLQAASCVGFWFSVLGRVHSANSQLQPTGRKPAPMRTLER